MTLTALIERVEAATEGSRDLDAEICRAAHPSLIAACRADPERGPGHWIHPEHGLTYAECFSTSIDAALLLVPEGSLWQVHQELSRCVADVMVPVDGGHYGGDPSIAATPALALVAACLKARDN